MFRAIPGAAVFYPSDAVAAERLTEEAARRPGICYIRTSRPKTPVLYSAEEKFPVPGFKVLRQSASDRVTVIGAGVTLYEALKAYDQLAARKHRHSRDRSLLHQADRRRRARAKTSAPPADASSPWKTTTPRAASAKPC